MKIYVALFVFICLYTVWVTAYIEGPVPYQSTCDRSVNSGNCSNGYRCLCATAATGEHICTQQMSCEYGNPCDINDQCEKPNSICVIDSRCPDQRQCYSTVLFSPELCPPYPTEENNIDK